MATPLGQMCPRESGSAAFPRTPVTAPSVSVSSSPQIASHRLQTAVRVSVAIPTPAILPPWPRSPQADLTQV